MKKTGVALALVGSLLALYGALLAFNAALLLEYPGLMDELSGIRDALAAVIALRWALAGLLFACAALGAAGAALLCVKGAVSGGTLVAAAVLSAFTLLGIFAALFFGAAAILAFVSDKRAGAPYEPPDGGSDMGI